MKKINKIQKMSNDNTRYSSGDFKCEAHLDSNLAKCVQIKGVVCVVCLVFAIFTVVYTDVGIFIQEK